MKKVVILLFVILLICTGIYFFGCDILTWCKLHIDTTITAIGTILLPCFIWWFGATRAEKNAERERRIGILNALFAEQQMLGSNIANFSEDIIKRMESAWIAMEAKNLYLGERISEQEFNEKMRKAQEAVAKIFIYRIVLRYSIEDIKFISTSDPVLFKTLYALLTETELFNDVLDKANEEMRRQLLECNQSGDNMDVWDNFFKNRYTQYQHIIMKAVSIMIKIKEHIFPLLIAYSNLHFKKKVGMNTHKENNASIESLEKAMKSLDEYLKKIKAIKEDESIFSR